MLLEIVRDRQVKNMFLSFRDDRVQLSPCVSVSRDGVKKQFEHHQGPAGTEFSSYQPMS